MGIQGLKKIKLFTYPKIHSFKMYNSVVLAYAQGSATISTINFRTLSLPQKEIPIPLAATSHFLLPPAPANNESVFFLSRVIYSGYFI